MVESRGIVLYDADCGLCQWSADVGARRDRRHRLVFRSLQTADLAALSPGLTPEMVREELYFVRPDATRCAGIHAVARTLFNLPFPFKAAGLILSLPPVAWLLTPLYRFVARNRAAISGWLGLTVCRVSSIEPS